MLELNMYNLLQFLSGFELQSERNYRGHIWKVIKDGLMLTV